MERILELCRGVARSGRVVVLTGAGVSAESGIPTFRGAEGYWTIGAREYHPQELATQAAFAHMPWSVWAWYLYRLGVCRAAAPNAAHLALARLAAARGDQFALVTQNVDGLHRRAGSPAATTYPIHGDIALMRCARECTPARYPIPDAVPTIGKGATLSAETQGLLTCPRCGAIARPHVLWFDESYDEERYHLDTVRALAPAAALLVVAGTSAGTNLPWQVVTSAARHGVPIIDVNVEDNPFGDIAATTAGGVVRLGAASALPALVEALISA